MTQLKQVYKCQICGNIVEVLHTGIGELVCCGQPMTLQVENTVDAALEKHVPVIEKIDGGVLVKVGAVAHPMTDAHYIEWIEIHTANKIYRKYLKNVEGISFQKDEKNSLNVCWMNAILIDKEKYGKTKKELVQYLKDNNVDTRLLFTGMHKQKSLKNYGCSMLGKYENTDKLTADGLYLPSSANLKESEIRHICGLIADFKNK